MKLALETNIQGFLKKHEVTIGLFILYALIIVMFVVGAYQYNNYKPIVRDFVIANVAHVKAGKPIPFTQAEKDGYTRGYKIDERHIYTYGIESNNVWAAEYTRMIIPYMLYEHVTPRPIFPWSVGSIPFQHYNSFHVAGRMIPPQNMALINERYFLDEKWNDKRKAFETLVHELVHVQRGNYINGTSQMLESTTSAATIEVMAGMCNYKDQLACKAFWLEIESLARSNLIVSLNDMGLRWVYESWANLFWRDNIETGSYYKAMRYWDSVPGGLMEIRRKYQIIPWEIMILGVTEGKPLDTGHAICSKETGTCKIVGMPFDDTWYLLQGLMWILE